MRGSLGKGGKFTCFQYRKVAENTYTSQLGWLIFKNTLLWRWKGP